MEEEKQNTETKKQEAIRLAWGLLFEKYKESINEDGYAKFGSTWGLDFYELKNNSDFEMKEWLGYYFFRPKSLSGIEDNNGWISIESEEDLKLERGYYWFKWNSTDGEENIQIAIVDNRGINLYQEPTHYQPIQKPNPPIF